MVSTRAKERSYKLWSSRKISHEIYSNYSFFFTVYQYILCEGLSVHCVFWWENRAQTLFIWEIQTCNKLCPTDRVYLAQISERWGTSCFQNIQISPTIHMWANLNCLNGDRAGASYRKRSRSIASKKFSSEQKNEQWENTKWSFLFLRIVSFVYV